MKNISQQEGVKLIDKYYDAFMKREEADWTEEEMDEFIFLCITKSDGKRIAEPFYIYIDNTSGDCFLEQEGEFWDSRNMATVYADTIEGASGKLNYKFQVLKEEILKTKFIKTVYNVIIRVYNNVNKLIGKID